MMKTSAPVAIPAERRDEGVLEATRMKASLRRVIGAKAALYAGGDEQRLLEAAVRAYAPDVPEETCVCGGKRRLRFRDREITVFRTGEPLAVRLKNAPSYICDACGTEYFDLNVEAFIEREIEEEVLRHLRARKEPPVEYDFLGDFLNAR